MGFGDVFRHMSPLYDAATGFKGTAAKNAMMVLGGKAMGNMGGGQNMQGMMRQMGQLQQSTPQMQETVEEKKRRLIAEILASGGY